MTPITPKKIQVVIRAPIVKANWAMIGVLAPGHGIDASQRPPLGIVFGPNFFVGEILAVGADGRDQRGRCPQKWAVEVQECATFEEAVAVAVAACQEENLI